MKLFLRYGVPYLNLVCGCFRFLWRLKNNGGRMVMVTSSDLRERELEMMLLACVREKNKLKVEPAAVSDHTPMLKLDFRIILASRAC